MEEIKEVIAKIDKYSPCFVVEDEIYKQVLDNDFKKLTDIIEKLLETQSTLREQMPRTRKRMRMSESLLTRVNVAKHGVETLCNCVHCVDVLVEVVQEELKAKILEAVRDCEQYAFQIVNGEERFDAIQLLNTKPLSDDDLYLSRSDVLQAINEVEL